MKPVLFLYEISESNRKGRAIKSENPQGEGFQSYETEKLRMAKRKAALSIKNLQELQTALQVNAFQR